MSEWIMAHPWLTFFFAVIAVALLDNMVTNICNTVLKCRALKHRELAPVKDSIIDKLVPTCPRCGCPLDKSDNPQYAYQCKECDEDFFEFEARWIKGGKHGA